MSWLEQSIKSPCEQSILAANNRQQQLTKPPGSLGQLETLAIQLAGLQASETPHIDTIAISIFAADHGIAEEQVSAFPQAVTAEMIRNFAHGGAAISVLAKQLNANLRVSNLGTVSELETIAGVEDNRLAAGTANFSKAPAMTEEQCQQALAIGKKHIDQANADIFIGGEMGIANTTSATALACALLQKPASVLTGPGTGINHKTLRHKQAVIEAALDLHQANPEQPLECLRLLGGFEIAALTGAFIRGAQVGMPLLVDGFIASIAALTALRYQPDIAPWLILGHQSAEPGHKAIVAALDKSPLLQLDMRLGEASGAACAIPLLQLACTLHNTMATFDSANISAATL
ncbi:nicotinate-nucleotide--dimethylbenzimidazole phosphoribosyltransferase [Oceanicoccus sagamiensis]|uniref:Nicotinate-nucleotide--dimethylbenzimidazole phosphoribosyltransferase n=1 Tax=Oceanicoccus sagamiensis TaxID=716816 RepID=A0A1X9NED4_9GAMM|nr:nicotinate-nucleotide--dimethylbenzimidazole phosphoribosyltransferase [Oceanicoccus sagamiensis]ARN74792.1 nicotinate-nucleotide--dimethylbenzimidazole phosphoribosyltransferase [Oceanicoccus sagamiensis]